MDNVNKKILLVDDEPNILEAVGFLVQQQGYSVLKAQNGADALHKIKNQRPRVIVLDVMMPGMDGFEVARQIRANAVYNNTHIIFLTAKGTDQDKKNGYAKGGEVYITKPFDNEELVDTINELMSYEI